MHARWGGWVGGGCRCGRRDGEEWGLNFGGVLAQHCVIACVHAAEMQRQVTLEVLWVGVGVVGEG